MLGLATPFQTQNYGTKLQAFAMQNIFSDLGYDVEIISYTYVSTKKQKLKNLLSAKKISAYIRRKKQSRQSLSNSRYTECISIRNSAFDRFTNKYIPTARNFVSLEKLKDYSKRYNAVICGSDQIWLPVNVEKGYFSLDFVPDKVRRIAYAPSFGISSVDKRDEKMYKSFLSKLDFLSCREHSGCEIIEKLTGKKAEVVLDPTLMADKAVWDKLSGNIPVVDGDYIFCYFLGSNPEHRRKVKELSKITGCKLVALPHVDGYVEADENYADLTLSDIAPNEFVNLIKNALYICTDSFHGSVFSTIFEKEYFVFERFSSDDKQSTNTRLYSLLASLRLTDRLIKNENLKSIEWQKEIRKKIDYKAANGYLDNLRKSSFDYIKNSLDGIPPKKQTHIEINDRLDCCGCSACADACPKNCIEMVTDDEGFVYPEVDTSNCVGCSACLKACPVKQFRKSDNKYTAFASINKDENVRKQSTSGGVFTPLAKAVIDNGGVVIGASFDVDFQVKHICVDSADDLHKFRSSKYVQSDTLGIYRQTEKLLKEGRTVMFSGTPCQVYALKIYLKKNYKNLITVDLFCHGVPSPKVWNKYLEFINPDNKKIENISFRDKRISWEDYSLAVKYSDSETATFWKNDPFARGFGFSVFNRPYCSVCRLKSFPRQSDITLGDLWLVESIFPEMNDHRGVSLVMLNTDKGRMLFDSIRGSVTYKEIDADKLHYAYPVMGQPTKPHKNRAEFFAQLDTVPFDKLAMKCATVDRKHEYKVWRANVLDKMGILPLVRKLKNLVYSGNYN